MILASILALMDKDLAWLEIDRCRDAAFSCGIVGGLLVTIVPLALAYVLLVFWRVERVRRRYQHHARKHLDQLVEAAGSIGEVTGRDDLCDVIQRDLLDRETRRPHLLVGGVGAGKTAVLVRLTQLLAERGAVPVPIRLGQANGTVDFEEQARASFLRTAERWTPIADADKVWRKLVLDDRVVVVADGLEEAMHGDEARESAIRLAIDEAQRDQLPLVVATRPHDALAYLDAAVLRLEPLAERAARDYILATTDGAQDRADRERVRRIVERAEVVETPLYMQVAQQLFEIDALREVDVRYAGRTAMRTRLLDAWMAQLIAGRIAPNVPLTQLHRKAAVKGLGAIACVGLQRDSLEVKFTDCADSLSPEGVAQIGPSDVKFAASAGARLELVETRPDGIRFRHSIMQAYLGARRMADLLAEPTFLEAFLERGLDDPGREFLMSLAMHSARADAHTSRAPEFRGAILAAAGKDNNPKTVDLFAAAVEIDQAAVGSAAPETVRAVKSGWRANWVGDLAAQEAKLRIVARLGEAAASAEGAPPANGEEVEGAPIERDDPTLALWHICMTEDAYSVRHAAAQELGAGGKRTYAALRTVLHETLAEAEGLYHAKRARITAETERRFSLHGWILPLVVGSIDDEAVSGEANELLGRWIALVGSEMHHSVEASLAQGLKYEANRRPERVPRSEARDFLIEQANTMLERASFWFSRISLLQALSLWALQQPPEPALDARRRVERWVGADGHVFVREAAELCTFALETGHPSRFIWIDEIGVVAKVGASSAHREWEGTGRLWISPAVGWLALDRRAQQLVGDIIILLNLAERGLARDEAGRLQRTARLARVLDDLPPCLTQPGGRKFLSVTRTGERSKGPGSECMPGCQVRLCPFPPKGQPLFRGELSETFCRSQHSWLVDRRDRRAPWQRATQAELRAFWGDMEKRAQV